VFFPWPHIWDQLAGFGSKNFAGSYAFPGEAAAGLLGVLGVGWNLGEKAVYFLPFAALSFLAPWLLGREIMGSSRWALLSGLIFGSNTYVLIVSTGGQILVAVAEVLAPLVLWAFIRALRRLSVANALLCGLLVGAQAAYEIRITYLTGLMCGVYLVILLICQPARGIILPRVGLAAVPALVLLGTQLYWLIPLITYKGDHGLPIAGAPWIAFMRITHGITAVHPFWTGSTPTIFRPVPLNPVFFLFPLIAFASLLRRRPQPETLWLCLLGLSAAFLIKQDNPPLGAIYDWLFVHLPGWSAFREASKLFFVVALSYAVLVPMSLQQLGRLTIQIHPKSWRPRPRRLPAEPIKVHPMGVAGRSLDVYVHEDGSFGADYAGRRWTAQSRNVLQKRILQAAKHKRFPVMVPSLSNAGQTASKVGRRLLGKDRWSRLVSRLPIATSAIGTLAIAAISVNNLVPALTGELGFTTRPRQEPSSFSGLAKLLDADHGAGAVVWLGGANVDNSSNGVGRRFPVASNRHPLVELTGLDYLKDPFAPFCRSGVSPFCYLDGQLFPYLTQHLGAAYVVAPAGANVGALPFGVPYQWVLARLTLILGQPRFIGAGAEALAIWHISSEARPVAVSQAIALIDGTARSTTDAVPALQALGIPAVYRLNRTQSPQVAPFGASIEVIPNINDTYNIVAEGRFVLMARTQKPSIHAVDGTHRYQLPLLKPPTGTAGWSFYGPVELFPGAHRWSSAEATLGPSVSWSQTTMDTLAGAGGPLLSSISSRAERVQVNGVPIGWHWFELRQAYDTGWRSESPSTHMVGDGIFNLYWAFTAGHTVIFTFSTDRSETLGVIVALSVGGVILLLWMLAAGLLRNRRLRQPARATKAGLLSVAGSYVAICGLALLGLATLYECIKWWGLGSLAPWLVPHIGSGRFADLSAVSEFYVALSMLALLISVIFYLIDQPVRPVRERNPFERHPRSPRLQPDQLGTSESITRASAEVMKRDQEHRGTEGSLWGQ
jgi:hypothetical protein